MANCFGETRRPEGPSNGAQLGNPSNTPQLKGPKSGGRLLPDVSIVWLRSRAPGNMHGFVWCTGAVFARASSRCRAEKPKCVGKKSNGGAISADGGARAFLVRRTRACARCSTPSALMYVHTNVVVPLHRLCVARGKRKSAAPFYCSLRACPTLSRVPSSRPGATRRSRGPQGMGYYRAGRAAWRGVAVRPPAHSARPDAASP